MQSEKQYIDLYSQCRGMLMEHSAAPMSAVRDAAFDDFRRIGFPTKKVERYKYTDVPALFEPDYGLNLNRLDIPVDPYEAFRCDVPNLSTQLYFVLNDGFYDKVLPKGHPLPDGVVVGSLAKYAAEHPDFVSKYYAKLARTADDGITALNTMLAQDGLLVYVPKGVVVEKAVQVINILGDNASLDLYCLEETHVKNVRVSNVFIEQQRDSRVSHNVITLHNGVTRNRTDLVMAGEGAECDLCGCVIADKHQHVDNNTLIDHRVPHCTSRELYKYVLDGNAVGAFAGKVLVRHGAQKTVSQETNQNLCATKEARMYTQPMLEIYADDVKCAHGSTVGQLNDAALFYMRQRGIPFKEAKLLLEFAFANEVIDNIKLAPLRDRLHYLVEKRFRGELNKCEGCKLCR